MYKYSAIAIIIIAITILFSINGWWTFTTLRYNVNLVQFLRIFKTDSGVLSGSKYLTISLILLFRSDIVAALAVLPPDCDMVKGMFPNEASDEQRSKPSASSDGTSLRRCSTRRSATLIDPLLGG